MPIRPVAATPLVQEFLGFSTMEAPEEARAFLADFSRQWPFTEAARRLFETVNFEAADLSQELGGGYWHAERRTVQVRGSQAEALIHELAHAWWEEERKRPGAIDGLIAALRHLADEKDPRFKRAQTLAGHYVNGIKSQPDPSSPTGYWLGMREADGTWIDWEVFAGLSSGIMGDLAELPAYIREFFTGLFAAPAEDRA